MKRFELKYITDFLKKAAGIVRVTSNQPAGAQFHAVKHERRGTIIRTPADSAVLRVNAEPWG